MRREVSRRALVMGAISFVGFRNEALGLVERLADHSPMSDPLATAQDEEFWVRLRSGFDLDPDLTMLNNGGVCPSPRVVMDAVHREIDFDNRGPSYRMWRKSEPRVESVRKRLAKMFGCDPEELAVTRNATEALQTVIMGTELHAGDEVLTTEHDYPRMITAIKQRERREGIKLIQASIPGVPESTKDMVTPIEQMITTRTRLILVSHVGYMNGTVFPIHEISELARSHGIPLLVDGAHAFAQFPYHRKDIATDRYGVALHKWLLAPIGTGFLYLRKDLIPTIWPLQPADADLDKDIRKFEQFGTHPAALHNGIDEALTFNEMLGIERKAARLEYLRRRWTDAIRDAPGVKFHSSLAGLSRGLTTVQIGDIRPSLLQGWLIEKHKLYVTTVIGPGFHGIRVSPNVYTLA